MKIKLAFLVLVATAAAANPVLALQVGSSATASRPANDGFHAFFERFRAAVLADDREAVAAMTEFPFVDFRAGSYCEPGLSAAECSVSPDSLTSADRTAFLAHYDAIFTPAVVAAIRDRKLRGFTPEIDDGEVGGPIGPGEYLLDLEDAEAQRVFVIRDGTYRLGRIPFYS